MVFGAVRFRSKALFLITTKESKMNLFRKSKIKSRYGYRYTKLIYTPFFNFYDPLIEFSIGCNRHLKTDGGFTYYSNNGKYKVTGHTNKTFETVTELRWLEFRIYGFGIDINWSEDRGFWLNSFNQNHSSLTYYFRNLLKRTK